MPNRPGVAQDPSFPRRAAASLAGLALLALAFQAQALRPADDIAVLEAGGQYTCYLTEGERKARCTGQNSQGKLGDGTFDDRAMYVDVAGLEGNLETIVAGANQTCVITAAGAVKCWGRNERAQLGRGHTVLDNPTPADVVGLTSGVRQVASGFYHGCALLDDLSLRCWGGNDQGQLGLGSFGGTVLEPMQVLPPGSALAVSAMDDGTCVLTTTHGVKCWGGNLFGQIGDGTTSDRASPVDVVGLESGVLSLSTGSRAGCVLLFSGTIKCWGWNRDGTVGDGSFTDRRTPVDVAGLAGVGIQQLSVGGYQACVLTATNGVKCWGNNAAGQVGDFSFTNRNSPVDVWELASGVARISAGLQHTCAVLFDGSGQCWGMNFAGALSNSQFGFGTVPRPIPIMTADSTPDAFSFAMKVDVPQSALVASDAIPLTGLSDPAPISVVDGEYSLDCNGSFSAGAGTIHPGMSVCVRHLSRNHAHGATTTTLTIGGIPGLFTSVTGRAPTTTVLTGPSETPHGVEAVYTAAVNGDHAPRAGSVLFRDNGDPIAGCEAVPVDLGQARCIRALAPSGTHSIIAEYGGDANYLPSTSSPLVHVVGEAPLAGPAIGSDFDGDGMADLLFSHADGRAAIWLMTGVTQDIIGAGTGWSVALVADFNGDGKSDLAWQHTDGAVAIYLMNGAAPASTQQILAPGGWSATHAPDLDGDGRADLVFQHVDGTVAAWTLDGIAVTAGASIMGPGTGWRVILTGDFDGDGKGDLLWKHADGRHAIWLMDGLTATASHQVLDAGGWTATDTPDLDGDGKADIVWQHADGTIAAWLMDGSTMAAGASIMAAGLGWSVTRSGDFDGDGKTDLFFENSDGRAAIWLMDGLTPTEMRKLLEAGSGWSARRVQDLDGDGQADIVWVHSDGSMAVWIMDGTLMDGGGSIMGPATGWGFSG